MTATAKLDLFKQHKAEYVTPKKPVLVRIARATYLAIDGRGAPGSDAFHTALGALYGTAFTIKMTRRFAGLGDYVIGKLEAQYWTRGGASFDKTRMDQLDWRMMIRTPPFVTKRDLRDPVTKLVDKGKGERAADVALDAMTEGTCVQMLHVGPYEREAESVDRMTAFAEAEEYRLHGRHHQIYLSDPRRVPPERLRTILRLSVRKA